MKLFKRFYLVIFILIVATIITIIAGYNRWISSPMTFSLSLLNLYSALRFRSIIFAMPAVIILPLIYYVIFSVYV